MTYASVCSGTEAFGHDLEAMGFECVFHAEIEPHASAVLREHYPNIPNYGDFTQIAQADGPQPTQPVRLLMGGTPCQDFSISGLRAGIAGDKGNLTLEFLLLARRLGAQWILWENVPGVLSSLSHHAPDSSPPDINLDGDNGPADGSTFVVEDEYEADESHAFVCFLAGLQELGYGVAYRTYDAKNFGVPQRRRRVFVVGYLGDWRPAAAVLLEPEGLPRNFEKGAITPKDVTCTLSARPSAGGGLGTDFECNGGLVPEIAPKVWNVAFNDINGSRPDRPLGGLYVREVDTHKTLHAGQPGETIVQSFTEYAGNAEGMTGLPSLSVSNIGKQANNQQPLCIERTGIATKTHLSNASTEANPADLLCQLREAVTAVRRLVPRETEALMGWAPDWSKWGTKPNGVRYELADGPRYRLCGNGWVRQCILHIAERLLLVDALVQ